MFRILIMSIFFFWGGILLAQIKHKERVYIESNFDNPLTLKTTDNAWLYIDFKDKDGKRKAVHGLYKNLDEYFFILENGANKYTFMGGNVGIGTRTISNKQDWSRVLDVYGKGSSKILATTGEKDALYKTGIFSHNSWYGGGGFLGTESNHNLHLITNYTPKLSILMRIKG